ncbi:hypothetical protein D3C85_1328190 [compost metagenome]
MPGVVAQSFAVGVEHHAGDHELDPRRAVDQPLAQSLLLFDIEDAPVVGREIASGSTVGDKPLDITIGERVPIALQRLAYLSLGIKFMGRAVAGLIKFISRQSIVI